MDPMTKVLGAAFAWVACAWVGAVPAGAQDRLPPIPKDRLSDAQKAAVSQFAANRGQDVFGPFVPLLRSPELMLRAMAMGDYLRYKSTLPARLSEFAILITAREWTQSYEWSVHHPLALAGGLKPEVSKAVAEGRRPTAMADDEEVVYEFCTELHRNRSVTDATYARAVATFGEQGVIDLVGLSGYYTLIAMVLNTARTPLPPGEQPALVPFPK